MRTNVIKTLVLVVPFFMIGHVTAAYACLLNIVWSSKVLSSTYGELTQGTDLTWTMTINDKNNDIQVGGPGGWMFSAPGGMDMEFEAKVTLGPILSENTTFAPADPINGIVAFHQPEITSEDWKMAMRMDWYSLTGDHHTLIAQTEAELLSRWALNDWRSPENGYVGGMSFGLPKIDFQQPSPGPVPEPATMVIFGVGLVGLIGPRLRKKK